MAMTGPSASLRRTEPENSAVPPRPGSRSSARMAAASRAAWARMATSAAGDRWKEGELVSVLERSGRQRVLEIDRHQGALGEKTAVGDPGPQKPHGVEDRGWARQLQGNFPLSHDFLVPREQPAADGDRPPGLRPLQAQVHR